MKHNGNRVENIKIAYIGGGSRGWAWGLMSDLASDVHATEKYGIYQPVGDTTGPGGVVRAMRTLPMFEKIALEIKKYCPDAWVINYTNPMTLCVVSRVCFEQQALLEAIEQRSLEKVFAVFCEDPLVTCSLKEAGNLFDEMVENTREYLGMYHE